MLKKDHNISTCVLLQVPNMPIKPAFALAFVACLFFAFSLHAEPAPGVSADALRADVDFIRTSIASSHPDPGFSVDSRTLAAALDAVATSAPASMTRDEAWRRLSLLNPVLADGHLFVGYADWRADGRAHLAEGGGFFPFEVDVDENGSVFILAALGGGATELAGARILAINGVVVEVVSAELLRRVHGDTLRFRAAVLSRRWWLYHWKVAGVSADYRLDLAKAGRRWSVDITASKQVPAVLREDADFTSQFGFAIKSGCAAVMKVGSFDPTFKDRFLAFTQAAFARMQEEHVDTLLIDVSNNGGGDDDMWLEGIMPYVATRQYRTGSTYVKRVLEAQAGGGAAVGRTLAGHIETWHAPQPGNHLLFKGKVIVLIGPASYSSTVLFANVMRDFGFADLAGTGHAARQVQSGGVRRFLLPNTGLALWVPRFILAPPAGAAPRVLLDPGVTGLPACLTRIKSLSSLRRGADEEGG